MEGSAPSLPRLTAHPGIDGAMPSKSPPIYTSAVAR
jgi:hypothetical protein